MIAESPALPGTEPWDLVRMLQDELAATNQEVMALTLDLDSRVEARTAELHAAQEELQKTNSELLQLTLELEERAVNLERANQELEAFSYSVSHDLRAPLRAVDGFLELLRDHLGSRLDAPAAGFMDRVQAATKRMGQLIDGLLGFSRLGRQEMMRTRLDLGPLIASVIEDLKPDAAGRRVAWCVEELPTVVADPFLMRAVFLNLLGNALKFTRNREEARIDVGRLDLEPAEHGLYIRDNGAGFDPAYAHRLFGVFQRLHRMDEFEGTGIGLANVHRILTRHKGRVWAEGCVDRGATFYLALPATVDP